jgi:hypothetical protein
VLRGKIGNSISLIASSIGHLLVLVAGHARP